MYQGGLLGGGDVRPEEKWRLGVRRSFAEPVVLEGPQETQEGGGQPRKVG